MSANKSPPSAADMQIAGELYERHKGMMLKTALEYLHDHSLAQDVVHDSVLRLASYADTLRSLSELACARYVKETVRSVAINCERKLGSERRRLTDMVPSKEEEPMQTETPEQTFIEQDSSRRRIMVLREALEELSEEKRALLIGKYILGESDAALAERLGVKKANIRMMLTRARREARRIMERKEGGHGGQGSKV